MKYGHVIFVALCAIAVGCGGTDDAAPVSQEPAAVETALSTRGDDDSSRGDRSSRIVQLARRTDVVSNLPGAEAQDPELRNAWGLAFSPRGAAWVSAAETGLSAVFGSEGQHLLPSVTIPPPRGGMPPSHPTGQVFNTDGNAFFGDRFIFVTEDGTIAGWQSGARASLRVDDSTSEAIYKGVTIAKHASGLRLYAANFHAGTVDVYDANYQLVRSRNRFRDWDLPKGFAPFNVEQINGLLFVTYAKQDEDKEDDVKGPGNGFVNVFDPDGRLLTRLVSRGALNSPWGLALAPEGFGDLGGRLLVGNFGDGKINVYDLKMASWGIRAKHEGVLGTDERQPIVIDGLWALKFGVDAGGFSSTDLYFTAGPNDEENGIFGELEAESRQR